MQIITVNICEVTNHTQTVSTATIQIQKILMIYCISQT